VYKFAGVNATKNVDQVEGLRATIAWTVPPKVVPGYSVSTWIAFSAPSGARDVSYRIAQVGWIVEKGSGHPRLFWEWGSRSPSDMQKQLGADVRQARPLHVEIDRDGSGRYMFYADDILLGTGRVSWVPTDAGVFTELQNPAEFLPGTKTEPELVTGFEQKIGGKWVPYVGEVLKTSDQFQVDVSTDGAIRIWDLRQPSSS